MGGVRPGEIVMTSLRNVPPSRFLAATAAVLMSLSAGAPGMAQTLDAKTQDAQTQDAQTQDAKSGPHLGKVLTLPVPNDILGFDIDRFGADGILARSGDTDYGIDTFDEDTGAITKRLSFHGTSSGGSDYVVVGIVGKDAGLLLHQVTPKSGPPVRNVFQLMNPVTVQRITGPWTPPKGFAAGIVAAGQGSNSSLVLLSNAKAANLVFADIAANNFGKSVSIDPKFYGANGSLYVGYYAAANKAVFALNTDGGARGGVPPVNVVVDLATGNAAQFNGYNDGPYGAGLVNGFDIDPNTGIAATTTELNAQVGFYDMKTQTGVAAAQLPCTSDTDQFQSGNGITADPVNKLFLVTEYSYCDGSQGSAIVVYDEKGHLVETITGFKFGIGEGGPAINPGKRMGWALSGDPDFNQLQQFFY